MPVGYRLHGIELAASDRDCFIVLLEVHASTVIEWDGCIVYTPSDSSDCSLVLNLHTLQYR